jgi:ComF family protein
MLHALKYGGQLALGRVLGEIVAACAAELELHRGVDCLLPVPLHPRRLAERGFNQSAEIARFAARRLALPVEPRLAIRCRDTRPQVGLTRAERRGNLARAFAVPHAVRGLRAAIVDDVITTGSTVTELAQALHRAGALSIDVWCVARAIPDGTRDQ